jgi:hypothetical protein
LKSELANAAEESSLHQTITPAADRTFFVVAPVIRCTKSAGAISESW